MSKHLTQRVLVTGAGHVTVLCALLHFDRDYCESFTFANTSSLHSERSASLKPGPTLQSLIEHWACVFTNRVPGCVYKIGIHAHAHAHSVYLMQTSTTYIVLPGA